MKRHLLLAVGVGLAAVGVSAQEKAGDLPCPVDQVLRETREHNKKRGQTPPETLYQGLAQNYAEQCQRANKTISELIPKLKEYEAGKRDDRDGYIVLQKIYASYEILRAKDTSIARAYRERLDALLKKNPALSNMQDFRLSEENVPPNHRQAGQGGLAERAAKWAPTDARPIGYFGAGANMVVQYQFRLDFYKLPPDIIFENQGGAARLYRASNAAVDIPLDQLTPHKTLTFKRRFQALPRNVLKQPKAHLLICSIARESWYTARTPDENQMIAAKGYSDGAMPWINTRGQYDDFCGVIAQTGEILFRFPSTQKAPDRLFEPLDTSEDGRAAVLLGKITRGATDDGAYERVGQYREIFLWEKSSGLRRIKVQPAMDDLETLRVRFIERKL
jgi:hypothetical protein